MLVIGVVTGILSARALGVEDRGMLGVVFFWGQFLSALVTISLSDSIVITAEKPENLPAIVASSYRLVLLTIMIALPIGASIIWVTLREQSSTVIALALLFWVPQLVVLCVDQVTQGALRVERRFGLLNLLRVAMPAAYLMFVGVAFLFGAGLAGFVLAQIAALCVSLAIRVFAMRMWRFWKSAPAKTKALFSTAVRFHWITILGIFSSQLDRLFIVMTEPAVNVGIYLVAATVAAPFQGLLINAIKTLGLPQLVDLDASKRNVVAQKLLRLTWLVSLLGGAAMALIAPALVPIVFGREFVAAGGLASALTLALVAMPVRSALIEAMKANKESNQPIIAELVFIFAFLAAYLLTWKAGIAWPVIWALGCGNILSTIWLAQVFSKQHRDIEMATWAVPSLAGLEELARIIWAARRQR